jgi:hypothetical protein
LRQRHSRLEKQAREFAPRSIGSRRSFYIRFRAWRWNQHERCCFRRHDPTNQYLQQVPPQERRSGCNSRAYKRQAASEYKKALDKFLYGSLGGASPVRRIDPKTGDVVAVIDPKNGPSSSSRTCWTIVQVAKNGRSASLSALRGFPPCAGSFPAHFFVL